MRRASSQPPELAGYTFVRLLGSGGFSDVFLYDQQLPKRRVAIKVLLTDELTAANRAAFVAEANLMAQLSAHPYIVTIFHAGVAADDRPYFVMEYCSGPSLADRYKREAFSVADALRTGVRLSSAIATAHAAGILHRDIKPANVLTNDYGWPALTDFGISSAIDDELPSLTTTITRAASDTGTSGTSDSHSVGMSVPWSPAEMFDDNPVPDVRSDVFSLAATIYTLLAGHTPFEVAGRSNGALDLIGRIERGSITPLSRTDVPASLVAVLQKGMATRREDRFASAVDFARALQRVELELSYSPTTIDVPNLAVEAEARSEGSEADAADRTTARSVSVIQAQPAPPPVINAPVFPGIPAAGAAAPVVPRAVEAETVIRGVRGSAVPTIPSETLIRPKRQSEPEPFDDEPRPAKRKVTIIVIASLAAVIAAAIVVGVLNGGLPTANQAASSTKPKAADVLADGIPSPTLVSRTASADGTVVTFVWKAAGSKPGDSYIWHRTDRSDQSVPVPTSTPSAQITGVTAGVPVCIEVVVRRSGKTSPVPLEVCFPK